MLVYVIFGGMLATTWVQIVKAVLLTAGTILLSVLVLAQFHFSLFEFFDAIARVTGSFCAGGAPAQFRLGEFDKGRGAHPLQAEPPHSDAGRRRTRSRHVAGSARPLVVVHRHWRAPNHLRSPSSLMRRAEPSACRML
jgi:Na+(H+)/acetate symporter ActP